MLTALEKMIFWPFQVPTLITTFPHSRDSIPCRRISSKPPEEDDNHSVSSSRCLFEASLMDPSTLPFADTLNWNRLFVFSRLDSQYSSCFTTRMRRTSSVQKMSKINSNPPMDFADAPKQVRSPPHLETVCRVVALDKLKRETHGKGCIPRALERSDLQRFCWCRQVDNPSLAPRMLSLLKSESKRPKNWLLWHPA